MSNDPNCRKTIIDFLEKNHTEQLRLYGGFCDKADVDPINFPPTLKKLILRDMPSVGLPHLWEHLPELSEFTIHNVDDFTKENYAKMCKVFLEQSTPMEKLWLESLAFEIDEQAHKDLLIAVYKRHHKTLRHISLARNKFTNKFLDDVLEQLAAMDINVIETVNLMYLKDTNETNWVQIL